MDFSSIGDLLRVDSTRLVMVLDEHGIRLSEPHRGTFLTLNNLVTVNLEGDGILRFCLPHDGQLAARELLSDGTVLPGNMRFALFASQVKITAETRINGVNHLARTLPMLRDAFDRITKILEQNIVPNDPDDDRLDSAAVQDVINRVSVGQDKPVELDDGWELRPRINGDVAPVRVRIAGDALSLSRTVLPNIGTGDRADAVLHEALRVNGQLRLSRLCLDNDSTLIAESKLHAGQLDADWMEHTARSVAFAARFATAHLEPVASNRSVVEWYTKLILNPA